MPVELDVHIILDNYSTHKSGLCQHLAKAKETTPVSFSLHSHQQFLAQSSRTLVRS